jgi:predicted nucleic acid-binding protein
MPVIDTSFLMALFDEDHPRHKEARRLMRSPDAMYVSGGVLGEFTTIVRRRANEVGLDGEEVARELLMRLQSLRHVHHATFEDASEISRIYRENRGIGYVDAWGVALACSRKERLYSFDRRQKVVYRKESKT